mmetsp:Transcript_101951/g.288687  ORF Transcript_101951/g.288687 Transcript_101951/m.288687 type:complete len:313 (+) Transcript_101951:465-1403(+)
MGGGGTWLGRKDILRSVQCQLHPGHQAEKKGALALRRRREGEEQVGRGGAGPRRQHLLRALRRRLRAGNPPRVAGGLPHRRRGGRTRQVVRRGRGRRRERVLRALQRQHRARDRHLEAGALAHRGRRGQRGQVVGRRGGGGRARLLRALERGGRARHRPRREAGFVPRRRGPAGRQVVRRGGVAHRGAGLLRPLQRRRHAGAEPGAQGPPLRVAPAPSAELAGTGPRGFPPSRADPHSEKIRRPGVASTGELGRSRRTTTTMLAVLPKQYEHKRRQSHGLPPAFSRLPPSPADAGLACRLPPDSLPDVRCRC